MNELGRAVRWEACYRVWRAMNFAHYANNGLAERSYFWGLRRTPAHWLRRWEIGDIQRRVTAQDGSAFAGLLLCVLSAGVAVAVMVALVLPALEAVAKGLVR